MQLKGKIFRSFLFSSIFITSTAFAAPSLKIQLSTADSHYSCGEKFKGALQPGSVSYLKLKIVPTGFSARNIKYSVVYTNNGYKKNVDKMVTYTTFNTGLSIPMYPIEDHLPFVVNQVVVTAKSGNETAVATFPYRVMRNIILEKSDDDTKDCFTMYKSEKISGVYTNTSSEPRVVYILDELTNTRYSQSAKSVGWFLNISPVQYFNFGLNGHYVKSVGRAVSMRTAIGVSTFIKTHEALVIMRQLTMFRDAYDVKTVDQCGQIEDAGTAYYNHWQVSYPVASLDLNAPNPLANLDVGFDDQLNTCPTELVQGNNDYLFIPDGVEASTEKVNVAVDNPRVFNNMSKGLNDDSLTNREKMSRYKSLWSKLFKR